MDLTTIVDIIQNPLAAVILLVFGTSAALRYLLSREKLLDARLEASTQRFETRMDTIHKEHKGEIKDLAVQFKVSVDTLTNKIKDV